MQIDILLIFLVVLIFLIPSVFALTCSIRTACLTNETCVLSMYSNVNSHAGSCDYYPNKLCCDEINASIGTTCPSGMDEILSLYQINNTHVAEPGYYPYKLCAGYDTYPLECHIRTACLTNETCVLSMYNLTNSHIAECDYYPYKLCCAKLPDMYVNSSSIKPNETNPVYGTVISINVTVWNLGDAAANNVNVSCYENGTFFDSDTISSIAVNSSVDGVCYWNTSCNTNISVKVDPDNEIKELNESNNEAWKTVPITEILSPHIITPKNGDEFYRGQTIELNSTTTSSCNSNPPHNVYWYNESTFIGQGDNITWKIPLDDGLLGNKTIKAKANYTGYADGWDYVNITILNNLPVLSDVGFNVTPPEVQSGDWIEISCNVSDLEDCPSSDNCKLTVNVSILYPDGTWNNATASQIGNTFYRDFKAPYQPLGNYTAVCVALDSDDGKNESAPAKFLVWQNGTVDLTLNSSEYWWDDPVKIEGVAKRLDGTPINDSDVTVLLEGKNVCPLAATDANGYFSCDFRAPNEVGDYEIFVGVKDVETGKIISNITILHVKITYGGSKQAEETAKSVSCYEVPEIIQNPDGTVKRVMVRVCVWK